MTIIKTVLIEYANYAADVVMGWLGLAQDPNSPLQCTAGRACPVFISVAFTTEV